MKLIKKLSESIEEEIRDVKKYAKMAVEIREEQPQVAELVYSISRQEADHVNRLHDAVANLISDYRNAKGEPPKEMMALYNYLHEKHIDAFADAKHYQDIYSGK